METQNEEVKTEQTEAQVQTPASEAASAAEGAPDAKGADQPEGEKKGEQPIPGSRAEHIRAALEVLYERFPKCFIREGDLKPLKVGILEDLKLIVGDLGMSTSRLRAAVRLYTTRLRYLYNVQEGVMRIDLEGNETDAVTAEHAAYAKEKFAEINQKRKEAQQKRQEKEQQKRNNNRRPGGKPGFKKPGFKKPFNNNRGPRPYNNNAGGRGFRSEGGFNRDGGFRSEGQGGFRRPAAPAQVKYNASKLNKKDFKVPRLSPTGSSSLTAGTSVVVNTQAGQTKGVVASSTGGVVTVTLENGMTLTLPASRVTKV